MSGAAKYTGSGGTMIWQRIFVMRRRVGPAGVRSPLAKLLQRVGPVPGDAVVELEQAAHGASFS